MMEKMTLPHSKVVLQNKRMVKFIEWLKVKSSKNRQDVYIAQLKSKAGKQIWDLAEYNKVPYSTWKDTNNSGRTFVHHQKLHPPRNK